MSLQPKSRMTVEDFVTWAEGRPGRSELVDGEIVAMSPQRIGHARTKYRFQAALEHAIDAAGLPCEMFPDGITVRVDALSAYEPDALVRCGDPIDDDAVVVADPIIFVDILSPSTRHIDSGQKLAGLRIQVNATWRAKDRHASVIPGPQSGARNPEPLRVQDMEESAVLDSGFAFSAPE